MASLPAIACSPYTRDARGPREELSMRAWHPARRGLLVCTAGATLPAWLASCSGVPPPQAADFDAWAERVAADWVRLFPEMATRTQYFAGAEQAALDHRLTPQTQGPGAVATPLLRAALAQLERFGWPGTASCTAKTGCRRSGLAAECPVLPEPAIRDRSTRLTAVLRLLPLAVSL
jgi:hypothetical protein